MDALWDAFVGNPDEGNRPFLEKWHDQLENQDEDVHRVAVDLIAFYYLFPQSGLSHSDFYQIYAYGRAGKDQYDDVVLLYPTTEGLSDDFEQNGLRVHIRQFDPRTIYDPTRPAHKRFDEAALAVELSKALGGLTG